MIEINQNFEILFIGNDGRRKFDLVLQIAEQLPNLKFKIVSEKIHIEKIKSNYQNCADLPAIIRDQLEFTLIRIKDFSDKLSESNAATLENLDSNESQIVIDDEKIKLLILCERNYQEKSVIKTNENDRNILQNTRLKNLARSLLETLKDNARIVIK